MCGVRGSEKVTVMKVVVVVMVMMVVLIAMMMVVMKMVVMVVMLMVMNDHLVGQRNLACCSPRGCKESDTT